ncbi:MAG: hypothetical protein L0219_07410 [Phycisphaerales bacterium]|nr:hypothetical protein [Phycisphaerales bacterium]
MTEQENRALRKMSQQLEKFGLIQQEMLDRLERVERGLLGDPDYEQIGLVDDHKETKEEIGLLKAQVQQMSMWHSLIGKLPYMGVAVVGFIGTGVDLGVLIRVVEGMLR